MLRFKLLDTTCTIDDDYNIECEGSMKHNIMLVWFNLELKAAPSRPCPIDSMYAFVKKLGAEIIEYQEEFNPNVVY